MSECKEIKESLCEWLDNELPQGQRTSIEQHLRECASCREELDALRTAVSAVQALPRQAAPAALTSAITAGIRQERKSAVSPAGVELVEWGAEKGGAEGPHRTSAQRLWRYSLTSVAALLAVG